ncbi:4-hydroxy-tetrahydrodipicolinate reductase [Frateuria sp. Soil773]|uniref:4-hydroxy-tetrahydrodipicolinate reductase n=1 Tax=Frateuria sp. Soil773 TaxID=1736407 RepID=UPI0006FD3A48|nr:4-hydroxy-tetrahydrodipicolinate reductase [Frateuria sp. Soil773]KRE89148.1 4-hydroxy-tetrahydrodipicolinate reductase [Frateuria sp. Soil773]
MSRTIRIAVNGATGRMGRTLLGLLRDDPRFELAAALTAADAAQVGQPVFPGGKASGGAVLRFGKTWPAGDALDVVVDFSGPEGLASALDHCEAHGIALVSGTTGLDAALTERLEQAGRRIALLRAANFSLGVAVLTRLLREASAALREWDLEIVEAHHGRKEDAPSGTALALGEAAAAARGTSLARDGVYVREGRPGARRPGSIGFAVVRGGDVVGEHQALLLGPGERVELGHRATDRSIFARGAIEAACWLAGKPAGAYDLDAMLAERVCA